MWYATLYHVQPHWARAHKRTQSPKHPDLTSFALLMSYVYNLWLDGWYQYIAYLNWYVFRWYVWSICSVTRKKTNRGCGWTLPICMVMICVQSTSLCWINPDGFHSSNRLRFVQCCCVQNVVRWDQADDNFSRFLLHPFAKAHEQWPLNDEQRSLYFLLFGCWVRVMRKRFFFFERFEFCWNCTLLPSDDQTKNKAIRMDIEVAQANHAGAIWCTGKG